ncbi:unnamed protein product [Nezara viridula]|uniref:Uncharacterized protein n=1 Tax=Nezara viridula TaxID=85310 RepID=A0A9P0H8E8_NEZVI|nr:unnamed protein product [Nezara viridula]
MSKNLVSRYWLSSSDSESSCNEEGNEVIIGFAPEEGEKYKNCIDIVMKTQKMQGTIRMALNPTLEEILTDFFVTLEEWKKKESAMLHCDGNQFRKKKFMHSKRR